MSSSRAVLCQRPLLRALAITIALAGCGGVVASEHASDGSACPSGNDITSGAAVGGACANEGTYCPQPACDPCTSSVPCRAVSCHQGKWKAAVNTANCPQRIVDGGAQCVEVDETTYDRTCNVDADCFTATSGRFCAGQEICSCGNVVLNVDGKARYDAQQAQMDALPVDRVACPCAFPGEPRCVAHVCTLCGGTSGECGDAG